MKKMTTSIVENGEIKYISALLDDSTVEALEQVNDEAFTRQYIIDEHNVELNERKETRRHQSLSNGFDIVDERCFEDEVFEKIDAKRLRTALIALTPKQQELIRRIYFCGESQKDIAEELGLDKTSVRDRLRTIYKKIRNFFENNPH